MGVDINLESERGEVLATISGPQNLLHRLLEQSITVESLLAEIDWYGDTVLIASKFPDSCHTGAYLLARARVRANSELWRT
jgi:hypothetical protein